MLNLLALKVVACLLLAIDSGDHDHAREDVIDSIIKPDANCAVLGVYAALRTQGIEVPVSEIKERFPIQFRGTDAFVPMSVVGTVLSEYGVRHRSVQFDTSKLAQKHVPSLLLIHRSQDLTKGHYVLLNSVQNDEIEIVDPDNPSRIRQFPREPFSRIWQGYAICLGDAASPTLGETINRLLLALLAAAATYNFFALGRDFLSRSKRKGPYVTT